MNYSVELPEVDYFARQVLCREGCPVRTDAGGYVQAIPEGRYEDAYIIARTPNPFASICGRVSGYSLSRSGRRPVGIAVCVMGSFLIRVELDIGLGATVLSNVVAFCV